MSETEPSFRNTQPHHVGVLVKDIDKAIAHLEALELGPLDFDDAHKVFVIDFEDELYGKPAEQPGFCYCEGSEAGGVGHRAAGVPG